MTTTPTLEELIEFVTETINNVDDGSYAKRNLESIRARLLAAQEMAEATKEAIENLSLCDFSQTDYSEAREFARMRVRCKQSLAVWDGK